jgi:chemotaxis protein CheD
MLSPSEQRATHSIFDREFNRHCVKVLPGEFFIASGQTMIMTVLGSCVAACLWDTQRGVGGMNHFMLPDGEAGQSEVSYSMRYGVCAMEVLINELLKAGADRKRLAAKVFGGGQVMAGQGQSNVGPRNAAFVRQYLATEGIPIMSSDLQQTWGRRVAFFPDTGEVLVKRVVLETHTAALAEESQYARRIQDTAPSGDVDLF